MTRQEQTQKFDAMKLIFYDENEEHWKEQERLDIIEHGRKHPMQIHPYLHPNDQNLMIYPEPRHYGHKAGTIDQTIIQWFDNEPKTKAEHNKEKYALRELGYP